MPGRPISSLCGRVFIEKFVLLVRIQRLTEVIYTSPLFRIYKNGLDGTIFIINFLRSAEG